LSEQLHHTVARQVIARQQSMRGKAEETME